MQNSDDKIISKYFSENISEITKQSLIKAFEDIRIETRAEGWIKIDKNHMPPLDKQVLIVIDYSNLGRSRVIKLANLFYTREPISYGGENAIIGKGIITGYFYSLPAILPPIYVTHYRLKPELPNE